MSDLSTLAHRLLDAAAKAGADGSDALVTEAQSVDIGVRSGAMEHAERAEAIEAGLRVFVGQRSAVVSSSDIRDDTLTTMASRAVAMAREAPEDPFSGLADAGQIAQGWDTEALDLVDPDGAPEPDTLRDMALTAEAAAQDVEGVTQTEGASAGHALRALHLAASNGFSGGYARSQTYVSVSAISGSGTGMERDYDHDSRAHASDLRKPAEIGRTAGERAVARQAPRKPATGPCKVLFDERVSSSLIGHLLAAANGAMIARGASWLLGKDGELVLPEGLDLVEDPHRPRIPGSRPFDAEGLATAPRQIVADGRLTGWTLDLSAARKLGLTSTASAARSVSGTPHPSVGNLTLTPGANSRDDLIARMGTGLIVTSMIGSTINPNTGDYSRGASGFWVENGEIIHPVSEVTIAGSLPDMLRKIVPANDGRPWLSRVIPSLLIEEGLTLAGA
ncbi:MAG: modulator protein [Rhodobacterales bacterium]|nr:MAG: modulator protein [Rhodobacterales bacterium]